MSIIKAVDKDYLFFHGVFFLYIFISVSKANTHSHLSVRCPIRQNCLGVTVKCSSLLTRCFAKNSHLAVKRTTTICGFAGGGCSPITRKHASTHKILKKKQINIKIIIYYIHMGPSSSMRLALERDHCFGLYIDRAHILRLHLRGRIEFGNVK